ncbi:hypothetical protein H671_5g14430 [Cricetulus griseus]|nr:hypothetical protein H671_5g14430 [Cricetulus griseus]
MGTSEVSCLPSDTSNNSIRRYTDHSSSENERHLENSHASRAQTELPSLQMTNSQMRWSYPNQALADQLPNKSSQHQFASFHGRTELEAKIPVLHLFIAAGVTFLSDPPSFNAKHHISPGQLLQASKHTCEDSHMEGGRHLLHHPPHSQEQAGIRREHQTLWSWSCKLSDAVDAYGCCEPKPEFTFLSALTEFPIICSTSVFIPYNCVDSRLNGTDFGVMQVFDEVEDYIVTANILSS